MSEHWMSEHWMATDSVGFAKAVELLRALTVADAEDGEETDDSDVDEWKVSKVKPTPLTPVQRKHLTKLVQDGPYWYPNGAGEFRCANTLARRGMLKVEYYSGTRVYELTDAGREASRRESDDSK